MMEGLVPGGMREAAKNIMRRFATGAMSFSAAICPASPTPELISIKRIATRDADGNVRVRWAEDMEMLHALITRHVQLTESLRGVRSSTTGSTSSPMFWKVPTHSAMTEGGPMTIIRRHLNSI